MMVSGHLHRPYLIGCGVRSDDPDTFRALSVRAEAGEIDHIQVLVIPEPDLIFRKRIETIAAKNVLCILHAPHHLHGVNPCCPAAARGGDAGVALAMLEAAVCQTYEMADELRTPVIVLHAGHYQEGRREEAVQGFYQFLDRFYDPRLILENLPAVFRDLKFIGTTASDLLRLSDGKIKSYCLDFAHLYCTANYCGFSFGNELLEFEQMSVSLHHLSNSRKSSCRDEHLPLDHPEGGLDFKAVMGHIERHPRVHTSLGYKYQDASVYRSQVRVFDRLYRFYTGRGKEGTL